MKKKQLTALILSCAIISSLTYGEIANASNNVNGSTYSQNYIKTNIRKGICNGKIAIKDIKGNLIGYSNPYDMLVILSKEGNLYNVITQYGLKGYIDSNSFKTVKSGLNNKLIKLTEKGHVVNVSTCLNIRSRANLSSDILDTLSNGVNFNIIGKQGSWYKINYNGEEGFVYSTFVKEGENKSILKVDSSSSKTNTTTSKNTNSNISSSKATDTNNVKHNSNKSDSTIINSKDKHPVVKPSEDKGNNTTVTPNKPINKPEEKPQVVKPVKPSVVNNAPVLKANNIVLTQGEKFIDAMLKANAQDKEDGNITGSIVYTGHVNTKVPGTYTIHLSVKDSQGAMAKASLTVTVKAKESKPVEPTKPAEKPVKPVELNNAPVLKGHDLVMTEGQKFTIGMLGLKAQDKEDGNLTSNIKVLSNTVDTAKVGKYEVVVKVTDKQGASCKRTFIITVKAKPVTPSVINACPQITGHGIEIEQGTKFSVNMLDLKAIDKEDGNLTDSIKVIENTVNTNKPGNYVVKVKVTDKQGASMTKTFTITVNKKVIEKTYNCKLEQSTEKGTPIKGTVKYKITYTDGSSDIVSCTGNSIDLPSKAIKNIEVYSTPRGYVSVNSEINTITQNNNTTTIGKFTFKKVYSNYDISIVQKYSDGSNVSGVKYKIFYNDGTSNIITDNQYSLKLEDKLVKDIKVVQLPEGCNSYSMSKSESNIGDNIVKAQYEFTFKKNENVNAVPEITGHNVTINEGETFNVASLGLKATDKEDGNITSDIKVVENNVNADKAGTYTVKVQVQDSKGAKVTKSFEVTVKAKEVKPEKPSVINACPVIEGHDATITEGTMFSDNMLGLTAFDKEDGNLTKDIKVTGDVNVDKVGSYKVTAKVTDKQGASCTKTFTVTVKAKPIIPSIINACPVIEGHDITIYEGQKFSNDMLGVSAQDKEDGNLTKEVKFSGDVNVDKVGTYKVTAKVVDSKGASMTKTFTVTVKQAPNTAPVISAKDSVSLPFGSHWKLSDSDVKVMDKEDGNITNSVIVTGSVNARVPGTYHLTLTARDKQGAKAIKEITVKILAKAPTIDAHSITLTQGQKFSKSMLGLEAKDCTGKNITDKIVMHGTVNTNEVGTQSVRFTVTDQYGLSASKTITVTVKAKPVEGWTADSQQFHNAVATKMYSLVNQLRKENGVAPYEINSMCVKAANWKSNDMLTKGYFDHKAPDGTYTENHAGFHDVCQENIAQNWMDKTTGLTKADADKLAVKLFNQWKNSQGHKDAMLNDWNTGIGFGFAVNMKTGLVDATQDFI